jgi:hypothetical protein
MARGLTALRAALGAVGGVTDALQERERMAREKERERKLLERQNAQDAASLRAEQRQAISAGMVSADRFAGMTMPGATPLASMQPTLRQTIGGTEYVYSPELAQAEKHREGIQRTRMERSLKRAEEKETADLAVRALKGGRKSEEFARLAARDRQVAETLMPEPKALSSGFASLDFRRELEGQKRKELESQGMSFLNRSRMLDPASQQAVMEGYAAIKAEYPNATNGQIGYALLQEFDAASRTENVQARTENTQTRTENLRNPKNRPPLGRAPGAKDSTAAKPAAKPAAPKQDEFDLAVQRRK